MTPHAVYLGIDPGTVATGYALLEDGPRGLELVECGVCKMPARAALWDRLRVLRDDLDGLVARWRQEHPELGGVAVERPFVRGGAGKSAAASPYSSITVGAGFGVAVSCVGAWAKQHALKVREVQPATVKLALAGSGRADKRSMQSAAARLFRVGSAVPVDAADSIGVAVCAASMTDRNTSGGVRRQDTPGGRYLTGT